MVELKIVPCPEGRVDLGVQTSTFTSSHQGRKDSMSITKVTMARSLKRWCWDEQQKSDS